MLCRTEIRNIPNACHFSPLSVCLSCLMNNGLLKWCRLWRALGEVEPAYRASFSPVWGQEMSALFWRLFVAPLFLQHRPVWDGLYSGTHSGHYAPCSALHTAVSVCALASRIHSERSRTESGPSSSLGTSWALPRSSSHLAKNRKQIEACLDVHPSGLFRGGAFG